MSAAKKIEWDREEKGLRRRREHIEKEERDRERERMKRREQMGEEERDKGRKRVRRRRESSSSYYKWQSLPGAYDKSLLALRFPSEPLNCCHNGKVSLPPLGEYPSPLKDLFTGSNTTESCNFQDNIRRTTVPSPLL